MWFLLCFLHSGIFPILCFNMTLILGGIPTSKKGLFSFKFLDTTSFEIWEWKKSQFYHWFVCDLIVSSKILSPIKITSILSLRWYQSYDPTIFLYIFIKTLFLSSLFCSLYISLFLALLEREDCLFPLPRWTGNIGTYS